MEKVFIPKLSTLTVENGMFSSLEKFSKITGYIPSRVPVYATKQFKTDNRLTSVMRTLRNSVLKHSRPEYDVLNTKEDYDNLFSLETRQVLKERKTTLVQLIKKHESAMLTLREARMNCWKSKAKLQKYELSLETQRSSLRYNQNEAKPREAAIKVMEFVHAKWMATHEKDHVAFDKAFLQEIKFREKIQKVSEDIECDVVEMLTDTIRSLMNKYEQNISDTEIHELARQIYKKTCRTYKFRNASNTPCDKDWIEKPEYKNCIISKQDVKRKVRRPCKKDI